MRWRGAVVALILLATAGCDRLSDPVTASIFFAADLGVPVEVTERLPAKRDDVLRVLTEFGYEPDLRLAGAVSFVATEDDGHSALDVYHVPDVSRDESVKERLYLSKGFSDRSGGEGYGLILDVGFEGQVLKVVGFKAYRLFV